MEKIAIVCCILLAGCCGSSSIKTEVIESVVPVLYSPAPPVIVRPDLPIHNMTPEQLAVDGEVVKFYKATIKALIGYSEELDEALSEYGKINKAYEEEQKKVEGAVTERDDARKLKNQ